MFVNNVVAERSSKSLKNSFLKNGLFDLERLLCLL